jgi:hypothetical protein
MINTKHYDSEMFEYYSLIKTFHSTMNLVLEETISESNKEIIEVT